jgi:hypothetical protein
MAVGEVEKPYAGYGNIYLGGVLEGDSKSAEEVLHGDVHMAGNAVVDDVYRDYVRVEEVILGACCRESLCNVQRLGSGGIGVEEGAALEVSCIGVRGGSLVFQQPAIEMVGTGAGPAV